MSLSRLAPTSKPCEGHQSLRQLPPPARQAPPLTARPIRPPTQGCVYSHNGLGTVAGKAGNSPVDKAFSKCFMPCLITSCPVFFRRFSPSQPRMDGPFAAHGA